MEFDIMFFLAGLTLFIFGMMTVESSLKAMAGRPFKKFLQQQTKQPLKAIFAGTTVTAVLQSSSIVLLMVLSFVGAGIMEMRNALAVVLGSNLGTTLDSWIVAIFGFKLEVEKLSYPILAIALFGFLISRNRVRIRYLSEFLVGFALLFIGLGWMKESAGSIANPDLFLVINSQTPYLLVPVGFLLTVIIQSSSATMAITLTALFTGLIPLEHAAAMVIGAELGTSIKLILGAVGGIPDKKRVALGNFYINAVTLVIAAIILYPLLDLVKYFISESEPLLILVVFQTAINLISIILFLPFLKRFAEFLEKKFRKEEDDDITLFIHKSAEYTDKDAIELVELETFQLMRHAIYLNRLGLAIEDESEADKDWYSNFKRLVFSGHSYTGRYQKIKFLQGEILDYVQELQQEKFNAEQMARLNDIIHICREVLHAVKNIKDINHNLNDLADSAEDELHSLYRNLQTREKYFYHAVEGLINSNEATAKISSAILDLMNSGKKEEETEISKLFLLLREDKISDYKVTTLLNVYREVYSSHAAILRAVSLLMKIPDAIEHNNTDQEMNKLFE
ncbi:MAG TPA: Na/Pi symporter [Bacteroidia bacterium]|nr:Na/Pi symporter [Bacteroidia bacterium]